ncbi:amidohydrolase domain protein [Gordonia polyisoprenivorans VH2]|uniref:Amidohydrolase domain protein n=2 Tax=Gordonia polyisoprenivorans TaxID=84595 RepID=H6MQX0_GORPV|nr:amidohydrolase domain protein [Gordonia polyisoprenivorans VH2]OZC30810.1 amidohydrolase [Gordonia polyisoprenivorans]HCS56345.1 amidohydrolase [Gordonia polyisoprenivorans]
MPTPNAEHTEETTEMSPADTVLFARTIHTLRTGAPVEALALRDGRVTAVGDARSIKTEIGGATDVIDLGDATLTPGLIDGHIHPVLGLKMTAGHDLSSVTNLDELAVALRAAPRNDGWVLGWGLDPNVFGDRPITHAPIVEALGDYVPVFIYLFDAHSALASPAALHAAGVSGPRPFAGNAEIVCTDGIPTGHLLELEAVELVDGALPNEPATARRRRLHEVLTAMAQSGITSGNAMDFEADSGELVAALEDSGDLPIRLRFAPFCMPGTDRAQLDHIVELQRRGGRRWRVDGVKFMIDGTIDGGTAWLEHADAHGESTAPLWPDPAEYREAVRYLAARGVPTVTHAIGDAGIRYALDTLADTPATPTGVRHRIEHIETLPDDLVSRFAATGVVASMQPNHCTLYTRGDQSDNWSVRLGTERANRAFRTRDIRDSGALLALGSDWPVAPFDPRKILADAQLRRRAGHLDEIPVCPEQGLTASMALEGYTSHAARAQGSADAGWIGVGARADFTAFAVDPLTAPPDELADAPVVATMVDGRFVFRA